MKRFNPHFSPVGGMIAQGFGFTRNFLKERNNSAYFRLKKIPCGFKQQARARHTGEKCGLTARYSIRPNHPMFRVDSYRTGIK